MKSSRIIASSRHSSEGTKDDPSLEKVAEDNVGKKENVDEVTINLAVVEGREKPVIKYKQAAEVNSEESEDSKDKEPDSPADAA